MDQGWGIDIVVFPLNFWKKFMNEDRCVVVKNFINSS